MSPKVEEAYKEETMFENIDISRPSLSLNRNDAKDDMNNVVKRVNVKDKGKARKGAA